MLQKLCRLAVILLAFLHPNFSIAGGGGLTIHLIGDSITRGYGTQRFSDQMPVTDPFFTVRSIWATANILVEENASPFRISYLAVGSVGDASTEAQLRKAVDLGIIQPNDCVVLEDAGPHGSSPPSYRAQWIRLADIIRSIPRVHLVMMTMFDYPPAPLNAQYDARFNGVTMNQATAVAARTVGATLIDMNMIMDQLRINARENYGGLPVMHKDGIHPNLWGQFRMTGAIMEACGMRPFIRSVERPWLVVERNLKELGYGSTNWDATKARSLLYGVLVP